MGRGLQALVRICPVRSCRELDPAARHDKMDVRMIRQVATECMQYTEVAALPRADEPLLSGAAVRALIAGNLNRVWHCRNHL